MFSNPFPNAFGLDIGDLSIKLVQLRKQHFLRTAPHYNIVTHCSVDLPPGLIVNGELQKPEDVRKHIQRLLTGRKKQRPIKSPWVVAVVPETKSFIKLIQIKKNPNDLDDDDIISIAKKHIPFDEDNYYLQWQIIPCPNPTAGKTDVLIGASAKFVCDSYTYLLESLGLGVVALEIEALATARAMITAGKTYINEARAILDIGATRSNLIIFDNNVVQFSTTLPYSGELLTTALSQRLHLSYDDAEDLKKKVGLDYKQSKNRAWPIISEQTENLISALKDSFHFYYSHFPSANKVTHITMCGGGSELRRLDKIVSSELKIIARPGHLWKNLHNTKDETNNSETSLGYATAVGLALRAADNPFFNKHLI